MKQNRWSQDDCETLLKAVQKCKNNNRIDWKNVTKYFPGRTPVQCKSQYTAKLHYKSVDKVNMVWDYDANLLLNANVDIYGQNWKFLSESIYSNKVSPEAIRKQYVLISQHIFKKFERFAEFLIQSRITFLDEKTFSFYMICLGLQFKLQKELDGQKQMPRIYDLTPLHKREIKAAKCDKPTYQIFYKKLESSLKIHEVISQLERVIELSPPAVVVYLCQQFDLKCQKIHKLFL
ncbi:Myb-like_DNA-binding domain-containing protein [Hexamita inflata]|uniref:Myb-like DNA-binding domain-containing protein n=1 Tax=Hexamita inflata TaxID=28002 RepID=A0AA86QAP1_9EUKA|nr:Myb-like DNA-binding domain-containing protein [Hexamita inflata]